MDPWRPNAPNPPKSGSQLWNPVRAKIKIIIIRKGIQKSKFEAQGDPKMTPKCVGKSKIFSHGPRWVVFRKTLFYHSETIAFKNSWFQKSKEIIDKCDRKPGPENKCKIEPNITNNWRTQTGKKASRKRYENKCRTEPHKNRIYSNPGRPGL